MLTDSAHLNCSRQKARLLGAAAARSWAARCLALSRSAAGTKPSSSECSSTGKLPYRLGTSLGSTFT